MSKPAISKRLKMLEETGVLRRTIKIRTHDPARMLSEAADRLDPKRAE